jgi:molecular chaperone GrpE
LSEDKKKASSKAKSAEEKKKEEVLENIMEELEEEAKEKETADTSATKEDKDDAEANPTVEKEDKKKDKKNPLQEKIDELNDKVLRQMAEFENFRKRTDKEKSQQFDLGQSNVLEKLLPIVDNFERGLAAVPDDEKEGAVADGMNKDADNFYNLKTDFDIHPTRKGHFTLSELFTEYYNEY